MEGFPRWGKPFLFFVNREMEHAANLVSRSSVIDYRNYKSLIIASITGVSHQTIKITVTYTRV